MCAPPVCTTFKKPLLAGVGKAKSRCVPRLFASVSSKGVHMPNPGQPTISLGATGDVVRRLQRALRRTPNPGIVVDGIFGPAIETAVKQFQQGTGLVVDGIVGPQTSAALPSGAPMPTLHEGSTGAVVSSLQQVLSNGASGQWNTSPGAIDENFGPATMASVKAFQTWGGVAADGIVGDQTWAVSLHAASATLESVVGLQYAI
jgi:peptidoglycan hydrolase-like protein with peptidoglycan-binding domain